MAVTPKTIYLEMDEEVTSVIDKIRKTEFTDVVLVVPKDASISQSVVNLKLIKRKAEELNKNVSIVTQDKVARNLAAKIGIATAATAKEMPKVAAVGATEEPVVFRTEGSASPLEDTDEVIFDKESVKDEPEELTVVEGEDVQEEVAMHEDAHKKADKQEKNLMPKFPLKWVGLVGGIVILALFIAGYIYLPRAKANIYVAAEKKPLSLNFNGDKGVALDTEKVIIPTQIVEVTKEDSKKYPATDTKNVGTKATGTVFISTAISNIEWPTGTRIALSTDTSVVYRTNVAVSIKAPGSQSGVGVTAESPGEKYNIPTGRSFSAVNDPDADITSTSAMTGGETKTVKVVSQGDISSAKDALAKDITDAVTAEFNTKSSELKIIEETKNTEIVSFSANPVLNAEAPDGFTMTVKVTTKAIGFSMNDISTIISAEVNRQLGFTKQIIDDGSKTAEIAVDSSDLATGKISGTIKTTAYVAAKLDENDIKVNLEGLNDAKATNYLAGLDGVDSSKMEYWPAFFKSFPRLKNHIFISIQVADQQGN